MGAFSDSSLSPNCCFKAVKLEGLELSALPTRRIGFREFWPANEVSVFRLTLVAVNLPPTGQGNFIAMVADVLGLMEATSNSGRGTGDCARMRTAQKSVGSTRCVISLDYFADVKRFAGIC